MAWTVASDQTFNHDGTVANERQWAVYHFETFLPSKGWSILPGEDGGSGLGGGSNEDVWGCSKTITTLDGSTATAHYIVELEYQFTDLAISDWTGVPGEGYGSILVLNSSFDPFRRNAGSSRYIWLESDQNPDAWVLIADNKMIGGFFGTAGYIESADPGFVTYPLTEGDYSMPYTSSSNGFYAGLSNFLSADNQFLIVPSWVYFKDSNAQTFVGYNTMTDVLVRMTDTNLGAYYIRGITPQTVEIGGKYYVDLAPSNEVGIMLDMDTTDIGLITPD